MARDWVNGGNADADEDEDQLFTFEDVEMYSRVFLRGKEGYVTGKGPDVNQRTGQHMRVEFVDGRETLLKQSVVNRYLREKKYLWVDWDWRLCQEAQKNAG